MNGKKVRLQTLLISLPKCAHQSAGLPSNGKRPKIQFKIKEPKRLNVQSNLLFHVAAKNVNIKNKLLSILRFMRSIAPLVVYIYN